MKKNDTKFPSRTILGTFFSLIFLFLLFYFSMYLNIFLATILFFFYPVVVLKTLIKSIIFELFDKFLVTIVFLLRKLIRPIVLDDLFNVLITPVWVATGIFERDELMTNSHNQESFCRFREHRKFSLNSLKNQY